MYCSHFRYLYVRQTIKFHGLGNSVFTRREKQAHWYFRRKTARVDSRNEWLCKQAGIRCNLWPSKKSTAREGNESEVNLCWSHWDDVFHQSEAFGNSYSKFITIVVEQGDCALSIHDERSRGREAHVLRSTVRVPQLQVPNYCTLIRFSGKVHRIIQKSQIYRKFDIFHAVDWSWFFVNLKVLDASKGLLFLVFIIGYCHS